jgi:hypothetical protein
MYSYFLSLAQKDKSEGKPVHPFVQNAIREFERHSLIKLIERLDKYNLTANEKHVVRYTFSDHDTINLRRRIIVERAADGLLCVKRWHESLPEEILMTVSEEDFIPKVLDLYAHDV